MQTLSSALHDRVRLNAALVEAGGFELPDAWPDTRFASVLSQLTEPRHARKFFPSANDASAPAAAVRYIRQAVAGLDGLVLNADELLRLQWALEGGEPDRSYPRHNKLPADMADCLA